MIFLTLQPDKRTVKRKVDQGTSSDSTSTDNDIGGDTESVEESDENEGMHYTKIYLHAPKKTLTMEKQCLNFMKKSLNT